MIRSLRLANFRRHADLELRFDDAGQIILISGRNGVGKTTLLEGIIYALYGEGRHGRKHLDQLLRRGAEFEGMEVEMVFTVGEATYRVLRRRDGKASTAVLYANDHPLVEGQREVTDEITRVLGMDAAGFRLATIAQQKDLDGLASLTPAVRTRMVGRLLRLDALTRARDAAAELHLNESRVAAQLRPIEPVDAVRMRRDEASRHLADTEVELSRAVEAADSIRQKLAGLTDVVERWDIAQREIAIRGAELVIAEADEVRLKNDLAAIQVPPIPAIAAEDLVTLTSDVASVEREIAEGEVAATTSEHRRILEQELSGIESLLSVLTAVDIEAARQALDEARTDLVDANFRLRESEEKLGALRQELSETEAELVSAQSRLQRATEIGAVCDSCGQDVSDTHRQTQHEILSREAELLNGRAIPLRESVQAAVAQAESARVDVNAARDLVVDREREVDAVSRSQTELVEVLRRKETYLAQLERLTVRHVDLDELYARKTELARRVATTQEAAAITQVRAETLARLEHIRGALLQATERTVAARSSLESAHPSHDLVAEYEQARTFEAALAEENELVRHWQTERAVMSERLVAADASLQKAEADETRRKSHQDDAFVAGNAKRLLADVSDRLATTVRPALEGSVAQLLQGMSEGRFSRVRISEDYEISVEDDGSFRPVSELSGGEADLVALSMRLALAQIVADRHGNGGAGFLILDEPLGSQDPVRRTSILNGLRSLRGTYSQIFLISHVEGIDDAADTVVNVLASDDRAETLVEVV